MLCPKCGETINLDEKQCKHCKEKLKFSYSPDTANDSVNDPHRKVKLKMLILSGGLISILSVLVFILIKFII